MYKLRLLRVSVALLIGVLCLSSCRYKRQREIRASHADSVIFSAGAIMEYDRMRQLTDSFEVAGDISALDANRWRGVSYY